MPVTLALQTIHSHGICTLPAIRESQPTPASAASALKTIVEITQLTILCRRS
ncbi:hypothetical protein D3C76_1588150 [compost metagenome]